VVSTGKWSAAGKAHTEEQWFNGQKWIFFYTDNRWPRTQKSWSLVKGVTVKYPWRTSVTHPWHIRDEYVFPQNLEWKNGEQRTTIIFRQIFYSDKNCFAQKSVCSDKNCFTPPPKKNESRSIFASSCKRFLHLLSNPSLPSQQRGFLHETGFLRYKFSTSHFIDGRVFFRVPTLKWRVFFLNRLIQWNKYNKINPR